MIFTELLVRRLSSFIKKFFCGASIFCVRIFLLNFNVLCPMEELCHEMFFTELLVGILSREAITRLMSWRKRTATAPARQKHIKNIKNIKYIQKIKKIYKNI